MATVTITGFIYASRDDFGAPRFSFSTSGNLDFYGFTKVMPHTITVELPEDFNPNAGAVAVLERKLAAARDEAARAERELEQLRQVASKTE